MSSKAAATIAVFDEDDIDMLELDADDIAGEATGALLVGCFVEGEIYLVNHRCGFCKAEMQTIGVGHGIYECSNCAAVRSRRVIMDRSFQLLEIEE